MAYSVDSNGNGHEDGTVNANGDSWYYGRWWPPYETPAGGWNNGTDQLGPRYQFNGLPVWHDVHYFNKLTGGKFQGSDIDHIDTSKDQPHLGGPNAKYRIEHGPNGTVLVPVDGGAPIPYNPDPNLYNVTSDNPNFTGVTYGSGGRSSATGGSSSGTSRLTPELAASSSGGTSRSTADLTGSDSGGTSHPAADTPSSGSRDTGFVAPDRPAIGDMPMMGAGPVGDDLNVGSAHRGGTPFITYSDIGGDTGGDPVDESGGKTGGKTGKSGLAGASSDVGSIVPGIDSPSPRPAGGADDGVIGKIIHKGDSSKLTKKQMKGALPASDMPGSSDGITFASAPANSDSTSLLDGKPAAGKHHSKGTGGGEVTDPYGQHRKKGLGFDDETNPLVSGFDPHGRT